MNKVGIYIGRFQPLHRGHCSALAQVVHASERIIIFVGSAYNSVSPKNPFTWNERKDMLQNHIAETYPDRVKDFTIFPLRDKTKDILWEEDLIKCVKTNTSHSDIITLFGYDKDYSTYYLKSFPTWNYVNVFQDYPINATKVRDCIFNNQSDVALTYLPETSVVLIDKWMKTERFPAMQKEYQFYVDYRKRFEGLDYPPVFVTVDAVVLNPKNEVALIRRKNMPGQGYWGLIGGFVQEHEPILDTVVRVAKEKAHLTLDKSLVYKSTVIDNPGRSLRGRTITHAFLFKTPKVGDGGNTINWLNVNQLFLYEEEIFEDHKLIIEELVQ